MGFDKLYRPVVFRSGSPIYKFKIYTLSATPAGSSSTPTTSEETFTVTGLDGTYDKIVAINPPALTAGNGVVGARVSADDTIAITFLCASASGSPVAGDYTVIAVRYQ